MKMSLFYRGSKKYSEESLKKAIKLQEKMSSDLGGTEILKPLKHVFSKELIQGHPRRVCMIILTVGDYTFEVKILVILRV